jgi:antitoxin component YwqK of YwqJK toxin-antitoxin module
MEWYTTTQSGNPQIRSVEHYTNGVEDGLFLQYAYNGKMTMYGVYREGEKDGRFSAWFPQTGTLRIKEYYDMGTCEGLSVEYYDTKPNEPRKPKDISYFEHGLRYGEHRTYFSNGQLKIHCEYNDLGLRDGEYREWDRHGRCVKRFLYDNGELDGVCETLNRFGKPHETATYRKGELPGLYVIRYPSGRPKVVKVMKNNQPKLVRRYDTTGVQVYEEREGKPTQSQSFGSLPRQKATQYASATATLAAFLKPVPIK